MVAEQRRSEKNLECQAAHARQASLMRRMREPWRAVLPGIALGGLVEGEAIERPHVARIELLLVLGVEIVADIGEVERGVGAAGFHIYAVEVAYAIVVDHGRDSSLGN